MIRRVTDRSTFARFRQGRRARCGPLQVRYVEADPAAPDHVRVAYAIGRPIGNAVNRNRARRRLRAAVHELDTSGQVPPGAYLVSLSSPVGTVPYPELMAHLGTAISCAATGKGRPMTATAAPPRRHRVAGRLLMGLVAGYQHVFAWRPSPCRFVPSCSNYALEALEAHGALRGTWLSVRRLLRCHPWGSHGSDPVPERKAR